MSQKLSRKKIKRDEFMESVGQAFEYLQSNARKLVAVALVVVAALALVGLYISYSRRQEKRAGEALTLALKTMQAGVDPVAADPESPTAPTFLTAAARTQEARHLFEAVRREFRGTNSAAIATAYLGQIAVSSGELDAARAFWEDYLEGNAGHSLAVEVQVNLMALDRAQDRGDELVTRLRAMLSGPDEGLPRDLLWYQLAMTLDHLGREGEAVEAYQRLVENFPRSAYATQARERSGGSPSPLLGT